MSLILFTLFINNKIEIRENLRMIGKYLHFGIQNRTESNTEEKERIEKKRKEKEKKE